MNTINAESYLETLIQKNVPHTVTYTGSTVKVKLADEKPPILFTQADLSPRELSFVQMTKREVIQNAESLRLPERKPRFYHIYPWRPAGAQATELVEVDVSSAFWDTAYKIGLLSDRIFQAGEGVRKEVRLIALGSAAAVQRSFVFDGFEYVDASEQCDEWGRKAYFYVASLVTALCRGVCEAIPGAAALYWVDAVVCRPEYREFVQRSMFDAGFTFKTKRLIDCVFEIEPGNVKKWSCVEYDSGRYKEFRQFPRRRNFETISVINRHLKAGE